jgi:hypothetical protein
MEEEAAVTVTLSDCGFVKPPPNLRPVAIRPSVDVVPEEGSSGSSDGDDTPLGARPSGPTLPLMGELAMSVVKQVMTSL